MPTFQPVASILPFLFPRNSRRRHVRIIRMNCSSPCNSRGHFPTVGHDSIQRTRLANYYTAVAPLTQRWKSFTKPIARSIIDQLLETCLTQLQGSISYASKLREVNHLSDLYYCTRRHKDWRLLLWTRKFMDLSTLYYSTTTGSWCIQQEVRMVFPM